MKYLALGLILMLAGCASGPGTGHKVVVNPNCPQAAGPRTSPPAAPYDYGDCYPDLL